MEKKEYIERGALLDRNMYGNTAPITHRTYAEMLISSAPAADVAPVVHGEWIEKIGRAKCSICADECWADSAMEYSYCPNCGAKMDGGET